MTVSTRDLSPPTAATGGRRASSRPSAKGGVGRWVLAVVLAAPLALAVLLPERPREVRLGTPLPPGDGDEIERLTERLEALRPEGAYLVVDSARNRLRLFAGANRVLETRCSTGTGSVLWDPDSGRVWIFDTPTGVRTVRRKTEDPVWVKPDWAFVEEGRPVRGDRSERLDDVSLGDYGLYLGDGYIVHGTLFESLLGRPATHGCIRLGAADLELVYREVPIGAPVFLY